MDATRNPHAANRFAPGDGICLRAASHGKRIRRLGPTPDEAVNLFLDIDEGFFHDAHSINCDFSQSKSVRRVMFRLPRLKLAEEMETL